MRSSLGLALLALAASLASSPAAAWGPIAHQLVTLRAIDTLPKGLKPYYRDHRLEIPSLSPDVKLGEDRIERRFAVDRLLPFPFADVPRSEETFKSQFPEAAGQVGRLPWLVQESYARLVAAFKSGDKSQILGESDTLASLVADVHNPLALTDNADGQKTGQHGLWIRFGTKLPEAMERRLKLDPEAAVFLDDPRAYVFAMVTANYVWLDNLLYQEDLARRGQAGYTELYYEALEVRAGELLRARLSQAAADAGSYWYTAWTAAGRPELK